MVRVKQNICISMVDNKSRLYKKIFVFNLAFFFIVLGNTVYNIHYSTDDYNLYYEHGYPWWIVTMSSRFVLATVYWILDILHVNVVETQFFFGILLMLAFAFVTTRLTILVAQKLKIDKEKHNLILLNIGTLFLFANAFLSEWLYFTAAYTQWIISVICMPFAIEYALKQDNKIKNSIFALFFLFCIAGSYQTMLIQYAIIVMFIIGFEQNGKIDKKGILELIRTGLLAILAIGFNVFIAKIVPYLIDNIEGKLRINFDLADIKLITEQFIKAQKSLWIDGLGSLPEGSMLVFFALLMLVILLKSITEKRKILKEIFWGGLIISVAELMLLMIQIMQGFCWLPQRVCMPLFSLFSVAIWYIIFLFNNSQKGKYLTAIVVISIAFLGINIWNIQVNMSDIEKMNALDQECINEIDRKIQHYEDTTGIIINKIGFTPDAEMTVRYYFMQTNNTVSDIVRAFSRSWSDCTSICFYTGRNLTRVEVPEKIKRQFLEKNWDVLDLDEQLIFDNDTVYLAVY